MRGLKKPASSTNLTSMQWVRCSSSSVEHGEGLRDGAMIAWKKKDSTWGLKQWSGGQNGPELKA
jgi:hypothetical protein